MKEKLILVGNGMAGVRTLEELLKIAPDQYDITVFGSEPYGNYNRIMLSPVLAGEKTVDEIMLNDLQWYKDNNITLHTGKTVSKIDRCFNRKYIRCLGLSLDPKWPLLTHCDGAEQIHHAPSRPNQDLRLYATRHPYSGRPSAHETT